MANRKYRVVHCGTGVTGRLGGLAILNHPDLDFVGHFVFDPDKVGKDSGDLLAIDRSLDVRATDDIDALIALEPDFFTYFGDGLGRLESSLSVICRFLEAGINVGTPSIVSMSHPATSDPAMVKQVSSACARGKSSYYYSGSDPGYFSPWLAVGMLKGADEVSEILMQEIANYAYYNVEWVMRDVFGFGRPKEYVSMMAEGSLIKASWKGTLNAVAERMGIELEDHRPYFENETYDKEHEILIGTIEAGTVAACRLGLQGIYKGKPFITLEHVTRTTLDAAPHWPRAQGGEIDKLRHEYTVLIKGDPDIDCRVALGETRAGDDAGLVNTAMVVVNAIPSIVEHAPGIVNELDLPVFSSRNIAV